MGLTEQQKAVLFNLLIEAFTSEPQKIELLYQAAYLRAQWLEEAAESGYPTPNLG